MDIPNFNIPNFNRLHTSRPSSPLVQFAMPHLAAAAAVHVSGCSRTGCQGVVVASPDVDVVWRCLPRLVRSPT